jgi:hypothetical protein
MKKIARRRVREEAERKGYRIVSWDLPEADDCRWHVQLVAVKGTKPEMDFVLQIHRSKEDRLTARVIQMPFFVPFYKAKQEVEEIYRICKNMK